MSGVLSSIFIVMALGIVIVTFALGLFSFSPSRAHAAIELENLSPDDVVVVTVPLMTMPPYRRQRGSLGGKRLDRHDSYVWLMGGLLLYSIGAVLTAAPNSNLSALSYSTQIVLGLVLMFGTLMTLIGTAMGGKVFRWRFFNRVHNNLTSGLLGDDIRIPYILNWFGLLSIAVCMSFYAWTIIATSTSRLLGTLGGGLSLAIIGMCLTLGVRLILTIIRYIRVREDLLAEAVSRMRRGGN